MARPKGAAPSWERQHVIRKRLEEGWIPYGDLQALAKKPERTVRRDLEALKKQGFAVESRWNGSHKEWRIDPDAMPKAVEPGVLELIALTLGRGLLQFLKGTELRGEMESLFQTLRQASRAPQHHRIGLDQKFWFMPDAPRDYSGTDDQLNEICTCLLDQRRAEIWYRSRGTPPQFYSIEPLTLVVRRECLYVLARVADEEAVRLFDLTRIVNIKRLRERFEVPEGYEPASSFADSFGVFIRGADAQEVRILFEEGVARSIEHRLWHPSQRWESHDDGRVLVIDVRVCPELVRWILGFGPTARALAPPELVTRVRESAQGAAARYDEP